MTRHRGIEHGADSMYDALDRAAMYYRRGLREILEDCGHDKPDINKIRDHAERAIRAADYELDAVLGGVS